MPKCAGDRPSSAKLLRINDQPDSTRRQWIQWGVPIAIGVIGWGVMNQGTHEMAVSAERRAAYLALRTTAEECIDVANETQVQHDFGVWLYGAEPAPGEDVERIPDSILQAWEDRDECVERLNAARGAVEQLTDDEQILAAASDVTQKAEVLQSVRLERLRLLAQASQGNPTESEAVRGSARDTLAITETAFEDAVATFVKETRPDTSRGVVWTLGLIVLIGSGVALLVLIGWHGWQWRQGRRPTGPKATPKRYSTKNSAN